MPPKKKTAKKTSVEKKTDSQNENTTTVKKNSAPVKKATPVKKKGSQTKKKTTKTSTFILNDINAERVLLMHYDDAEDVNEDLITETIIEYDDIKLADLTHERSRKAKRSTTIIDPNKDNIKLWINMIDYNQNGALPLRTSKPCWWCRSTYATHPIGCPIKYNPTQTEGLAKKRIEERLKEANLPLDDGNDFFETEGMFCMFPCVKAYILDMLAKTKSAKYRNALSLLTLMHLKLFGRKEDINVAPSWKVLEEWGGHLTPEEYRASIGRLYYVETINTKRPMMYSSATYIQESRVKL